MVGGWHLANCANCGAPLRGAYCQACGQKRFVESDRRFGHLLRQFLSSATDLDSRFWRTLRALLFQPGLLSREYIEGRRARWIAPVSLFLAINVVYFVAPLHGDLAQQFNQQVPGRMRMRAADPDTHLSAEQLAAEGQLHSRYTAAWIDARVRACNADRLASTHGEHGYDYRQYRLAYDAKSDDVSKALVVLHVPFTALALMLLLAPRRRYFAEHFVIALHFYAFALLALQFIWHAYLLMHWALPASWIPPDKALDWLMRALFAGYSVLSLRCACRIGWTWAAIAGAGMLAAAVATNLYVYRTVTFIITFALTGSCG
jgi:hypothetical protein